MATNEAKTSETDPVSQPGVILSGCKNLSIDFDAKDDEKYHSEKENDDIEQVSAVSQMSNVSEVSPLDEDALLKQNSNRGRIALAILGAVFIITGISLINATGNEEPLTDILVKTEIPMLPSEVAEDTKIPTQNQENTPALVDK